MAYLLNLFILFLPFQFALNLAPGFDISILRVAVLVMFAAVVLKSLYKRDFLIPINLQSVCLILFFLINIFSLFFVDNIEFGLRKILFLASIIPLYFIIFYVFKNTANCKLQTINFFRYFIFGGLLASIVALIIFFSQFIVGVDGVLNFYGKVGPFFWGRSFSQSVLEYQSFLVNVGGINFVRAAGLFPDPHNFALFAGIILLLTAPFLFKGKFYFYKITFLFSGLAVTLSFSRGAYVALIGAAIVVFVLTKACHPHPVSQYGVNSGGDPSDCHCEELRGTKQSNLWIPAFAGMTIFLLFVFMVSPIKTRFLDTFSMDDGSNIGRIQIMKDGFNIFKNNFLFGVGIGNAPLYYNNDIDYRNPTNSHNTYLEIAIESGLGGLAVWLVLVFGTTLQLIKYLDPHLHGDDTIQLTIIGLIGALVYFSIYSLFEVFLYSPVNLAVLAMLLAISSMITKLSTKK